MSVTSATDPVETVLDLLNAASAGDWSQGTPDRIERSEGSEPSHKLRNQRLSDISLYVFSPVEGDFVKFSPEGDTDQTEVVQVDVFTNSSSTSNAVAGDLVDILSAYHTDNAQQTAWATIWPESINDQTSQGFYRSGFHPISVQIRLRRHDD